MQCTDDLKDAAESAYLFQSQLFLQQPSVCGSACDRVAARQEATQVPLTLALTL
jgi:hypothetical protein